MDRNLALEVIRATEAAALAAAGWMGKGDAVAADQAAVKAMHAALNDIPFKGKLVQGEGEQAYFPKLYHGELVGCGEDQPVDVALDALECTRSVAYGRSNAMAVVAMAPEGQFYRPPMTYLEKIAVGPEARDVIDLNSSIEENLGRIAEVKGYKIEDLTVVALDRPRHAELIEEVRQCGARMHLIPDGDVAGAIAAALPGTGVDVLAGIGGATAGVLAAAALRCIGGEMLARYAPVDNQETEQLRQRGFTDFQRIYTTSDLIRGDHMLFAATGVTDGDLLNGVRYRPDGATTNSVVMRLYTRTRRYIVTEHYFDANPGY